MSTTGYRQGQRRCPACAVPLNEQVYAGVHVDVCPECSGVWLDWLDGDVQTVVSKVEVPEGTAAAKGGDGACPVCATDLEDGHIEGIHLLRCGTCAGAFVSRGTLDELKLSLTNEHVPVERDPFLTRVLDAITRFVLPG